MQKQKKGLPCTCTFFFFAWHTVQCRSSVKNGGDTFAEVLQTEAAKNKSLKIDHLALKRVMNLDGSLKKIGGEPLFYATRVLVRFFYVFFFMYTCLSIVPATMSTGLPQCVPMTACMCSFCCTRSMCSRAFGSIGCRRVPGLWGCSP